MKEAIFNNFDIWAGLTMLIVIFLTLISNDLAAFYRSDKKVSYKILVSCLLVSSIAFVSLFLGGLWYVLGHTSFWNHVRDGDLVQHLAKGL